jgi:16S rRNA (uracil1498-N3)-methyltransferase
MDYFYTPPSFVRGLTLVIEGEELHHLSKVLRKKVGEEIIVVDGKEHAYKAVLESISKLSAECKVLETFHHFNEPDVEVKLAFALLKNPSRMDFLVEKCTELGVREFIPACTERTIVSTVHTERLQKIALSAMKQCGRSFLPPIRDLTDFRGVLRSLQSCDKKIIMHERADTEAKPLGKIEADDLGKPVGILIGPEGGFTDDEVQAAQNAGFVPVSLGTRRLRSETAAIAALSAIILIR